MRAAARCLVLLVLVSLVRVPSADATDFPLGDCKLSLTGGKAAKGNHVTFDARFSGALGGMDPRSGGGSLRVYGGQGEGDSGLINLPGAYWRGLPKGKGFRYDDPSQSAGGIRTVMLRVGKHGGQVKITGGKANWTYQVSKPQTVVNVTLTIGDSKWCAEIQSPKTHKSRVVGKAEQAPAVCPCERFDSTWKAIQSLVFVNDGCTNATCHGGPAGAKASGGLDLSPDVAYKNLVPPDDSGDRNDPACPPEGCGWSVAAQMYRVQPGSPRNDSFLWRKLAVATLGASQIAGKVEGAPMPNGGLPPIPKDQLEAIRLWIQFGAKQDGVVAGTDQLLNSCLPPAAPPHIDPPDPPAAGTGVQFHAPPWNLPPHSENEVCYASYFKLTSADVPPEYQIPCPDLWGGPTKTCFVFKDSDLTQEPNSHHSIIHIYRGAYGLDAPGFDHYCSSGPNRGSPCNPANPGQPVPTGDACGGNGQCVAGFNFRCGGTADGAPCDPRDASACPAGTACQGVVKQSLACLTFGPPDFTDVSSAISGSGNSNAPQIGGSQQPFLKRDLPDGVFGVYPMEAVWVWNSHAFNLTDQPTYNQQWYNVYFAPVGQWTYPERGVFDAADIFIENVPPFQQVEYCRTLTFGVGTRLFELSSHTHSRGRLFRTWGPYIDPNGNQVTTSITPHCRSTTADPGLCVAETAAPIAVTTQYNDPTDLLFDPPVQLDDPDPAKRTYKFCSVYDNGFTDPATVKLNSNSPIPPTFGTLAPGGPCLVASPSPFQRNLGIACTAGPKKGQACGTASAPFSADNSLCDSSAGAGDGVCDACPLLGGVTTQDEMFIPLGTYYCAAPNDDCANNGYAN